MTHEWIPLDSALFQRQSCTSQHCLSASDLRVMKHLCSSYSKDITLISDNGFRETKRMRKIRTSLIHRKWWGRLALLEYKGGVELYSMSSDLLKMRLDRGIPIPSCAAVASGRHQHVDEHQLRHVLTTTLQRYYNQLFLLTTVNVVIKSHQEMNEV